MEKQILREKILMEIEKLPEVQLQEMLDFTENLLGSEKGVQSLRTQNEKNSLFNSLIRFAGSMSHNSTVRDVGKKLSMFLRVILIADEDYRIRNLIRLMFTESMGYMVVDTSSGADAILKARIIRPDIILADASLPDKNGYNLSEEIKDDPLLKNIPVVLLTSEFDPFNEKKVLESHVDDIFVKPFEPEETIKKVESLLSQSKRKEIRSDLDLQAERSYTEKSLVLFKVFNEAMRGLGKCVDFNKLNPICLSIAEDLREFYQLPKGSVEDFKMVIRQIKDKKVLNGKLMKPDQFTKDIKGFYKILNCYAECFKITTLKLRGRHFLSNKTLKIRPFGASSPRLDIRPSFAQSVSLILSMGLGMILLITALFSSASYKEKAVFVRGTEKETSFLEANNARYDKSINLVTEGDIVKQAEEGSNKLKPKLRERVKRGNYVIKEGDTLWNISRRFNISVEDLKAVNKLEDDKIYAGDVVTIPLFRTR